MYVFKKELFKEIDRFPYSISKDFMPKILRRCCVSVYQYNGVWADIGLPSDYLKLNFQLLVKKHPKGYVSPTAKVSERSVLNPPYFIGDQVSIGSDTYVNPNTVIGKRSKIGEGVYLQEALLMEGVKVGDHSYISNVIIADNSRIGKWNRIMEGSILGEEVITKDGVMLNQKTIILPYKEVSDSVTERVRSYYDIGGIVDEIKVELKRRQILNTCVGYSFTSTLLDNGEVGISHTIGEGKINGAGSLIGKNAFEVVRENLETPLQRSLSLSIYQR